MADVLLVQDAATVVEFTPLVRPASATLVFRSPGGSSLLTPTVTVDSLSRTVTAVDATIPEQKFTSASGSGTPVVGRRYWWTSSDDGAHEALVRVAELDANVWTLEAPVPGATKVQVNDLLRGARLTATITSAVTDERAENYQLEWTITDGAGTVHPPIRQMAHVVRTGYLPPCSAASAADFVSSAYPNHYVGRTYGFWLDLAERASDRVWRRVRRGGRFVHLVGGSDSFEPAGRLALQIELAQVGILPSSYLDRATALDDLEKRLEAEIADAVDGQFYDEDDDGVVGVAEVSNHHAIRLRRY